MNATFNCSSQIRKRAKFYRSMFYRAGFSPREIEFFTGKPFKTNRRLSDLSVLAHKRKTVYTAIWNRVHGNDFTNKELRAEELKRIMSKVYPIVLYIFSHTTSPDAAYSAPPLYSRDPDIQLTFIKVFDFVQSMFRVWYNYPGFIPAHGEDILYVFVDYKDEKLLKEINRVMEMFRMHSNLLDFISEYN